MAAERVFSEIARTITDNYRRAEGCSTRQLPIAR
jgi:hypothetical protein